MAETQRVDKWLWYARFFKSRSLATKFVAEGKLRVNSTRISKPAHGLVVGDMLTFVKAEQVRVIEVANLGTRRGPAPEAQQLYNDQSPPPPKKEYIPPNPKFEGNGRPTKKDRRQTDAFHAKRLD
ncbi:RNA-binding S4 domain-containing protein [Amylibacter sp. SFDW26]|uniref:RNA-binding S4 domain-containing protein n=1 Tax=Amylibacter sp. SFDW26 TaxID=2652722 RepID=UPI0012615406|nr:RNA-binding S4 domain-containing protein [Amylibacter sp. SFDW26]KAB7616204.1 RNA-binding S4 domain-containing protein [Amylibacter sp. SFDW26]